MRLVSDMVQGQGPVTYEVNKWTCSCDVLCTLWSIGALAVGAIVLANNACKD